MKAVAIFAILLYFMIASSGQAHATPETDMHDAALFCRALDIDSSPQNIVAQFEAMGDVGYTVDHAADIATYAISVMCPEFADEIQAAYDFYANPNLRNHAV